MVAVNGTDSFIPRTAGTPLFSSTFCRLASPPLADSQALRKTSFGAFSGSADDDLRQLLRRQGVQQAVLPLEGEVALRLLVLQQGIAAAAFLFLRRVESAAIGAAPPEGTVAVEVDDVIAVQDLGCEGPPPWAGGASSDKQGPAPVAGRSARPTGRPGWADRAGPGAGRQSPEFESSWGAASSVMAALIMAARGNQYVDLPAKKAALLMRTSMEPGRQLALALLP